MEREFISYKQALALKELGFDEKCFKYWVGEIHEKNIVFVLDSEKLNDDELLAPLKQQVFRWFRENYNLYGCIVYQESYRHMYEIVDITGELFEHIVYENEYSTYEEAENACIDKLISIAKQ